MLLDKIKSDLIESQKQGGRLVVETLRFLLGQIQNLEIAKYPPIVVGGELPGHLSDEDVISVIEKQLKNHQEAIILYQKGQRSDLVERETKQMGLLQNYLPPMVDADQMKGKVVEILGENPEIDMKLLISRTSDFFAGKRIDKGLIVKLAREYVQINGSK